MTLAKCSSAIAAHYLPLGLLGAIMPILALSGGIGFEDRRHPHRNILPSIPYRKDLSHFVNVNLLHHDDPFRK